MRTESGSVGSGRIFNIAVIGSGISGLSAAWLLSRRHRVTLFEAERRLGGHSHTVDASGVAVDTGFIVYNDATYPNLAALFRHLGVTTKPSDMSFAVSLDDGRLEYSGTGFSGLFAQGRNTVSPRFWRMLLDLVRFYREAPRDSARLGATSLGDYLDSAGYGAAFRDDHLFPMAAAIWSTPAADIGQYPAAAFIRFCETHGLLKLSSRPIWRTVEGGSRSYVQRLSRDIPDIVSGHSVKSIARHYDGIIATGEDGERRRFDHVVIATHADHALGMLADPSIDERRLLGAFSYLSNDAVLHSDTTLMPRRRKVWSSWNYMSRTSGGGRQLAVTYWMNRLQGIPDGTPLFVTLNPHREVSAGTIIRRLNYRHPSFNAAAMAAQEELWSLQGVRNTWFCGSYFGSGFHEDGLQAGLAVAETLGAVRRPWTVADESGRIHVRNRETIESTTEAA
jgi:predicted NAD/FAD-binding protein